MATRLVQHDSPWEIWVVVTRYVAALSRWRIQRGLGRPTAAVSVTRCSAELTPGRGMKRPKDHTPRGLPIAHARSHIFHGKPYGWRLIGYCATSGCACAHPTLPRESLMNQPDSSFQKWTTNYSHRNNGLFLYKPVIDSIFILSEQLRWIINLLFKRIVFYCPVRHLLPGGMLSGREIRIPGPLCVNIRSWQKASKASRGITIDFEQYQKLKDVDQVLPTLLSYLNIRLPCEFTHQNIEGEIYCNECTPNGPDWKLFL
jgi:hypothetical protein